VSTGRPVAEVPMQMRALFGPALCLALTAPAAHGIDRGQYKDVPPDIRAWFKGVKNADGIPCCDISDGHRTTYDVRSGAYWVPIDGTWWKVPDAATIRNAGNPLGEAVVWYVNQRGNVTIRCFVPADVS
jgi:hypothetical protein